VGLKRYSLVLGLLLIIALVVIGTPASANTVTINPGTNTIADNIGSVNTDGTLYLNPGIYNETGTISMPDGITIEATGSDDASTTVIVVQGTNGLFTNFGTSPITFQNITIQNATDNTYNGGVITANGNVTLSGMVINNCRISTMDGGALYTAGNVTLISSTISNCSTTFSDGYGGAIYAKGIIAVSGSTISNCTAGTSGGAGGALYSGYVSSTDPGVTITSSTISGCSSSDGAGGGIFAEYSGVTVTDSTISDCTVPLANGAGGAIDSEAGTIIISGSTITNCSAGKMGGAIDGYFTPILVTDSTINNCTAVQVGGAIDATDGVTITSSSVISNCSVIGTTTGNGGGAVESGGSVSLSGSTIYNCTTSIGDGGAIYSSLSVTLTSGALIANCTVPNGGDGGGVYVLTSASTVTMGSGTMITNCSATGGGSEGGAIYTPGAVQITQATISNCFVTGNGVDGGAIYSSGTVQITQSTISTCLAIGKVADGGAIYTTRTVQITQSTITNSTATEDGGALYLVPPSSVTPLITSSTIYGCTAGLEGGAVYQSGSLSTLNINFTRIVNNNAAGAAVSGAIVATDNWWGTNTITDPSSYADNGATYIPWLDLGIVANPAFVSAGGSSLIQANLTYDNASFNHNPALGCLPDGIPVQFSLLSGSGSITSSTGTTASGASSTTYNAPGSATLALVQATVDGQPVSVPINVGSGGSGQPTAAFVFSPTSGAAPLMVTFTDQSTVYQGTMWNWSFGDSTWSNGTSSSNPTHSFAQGTYTTSLTVTNASGSNTFTNATQLVVSAPPGQPTAAFTGIPTSGTVPLTVQFTDQSSNYQGSMWNWSLGDGTWFNTTATSSPSHQYTNTGTYTVALTVTNATGSNTAKKNSYITVSAVPTTRSVKGGHSAGTDYWENTGSPGSSGYTGPSYTPAISNPTPPTSGGKPVIPVQTPSPDFTEIYPIGFPGLIYNAGGSGVLSIDLAAAQTARATITTFSDRIEVYQHHSPGVTITFWGNAFVNNNSTITGPVSHAEFVTDPLPATFTLGSVTGSVHAVLPALTQPALMTNTISNVVSADTTSRFETILANNNLVLNNIAYTLNVNKINLTTGPANITLTIPPTWVNLNGGIDAVHITRYNEESGQMELLQTTYGGLDTQGNMIFRGDSPNGTSLFGLVVAEATSAEETEHPNVTYVGVSRSSMVTDLGMYGWIVSIVTENPVLIIVAIIVVAAAFYFGWWKRRL
jgi:PKD repeat protein